ncbi:MAG: hypothetical protein C0432_03250 [Candidatus Puniceispirillum sp.]|nr:hypothetical protein [Candidatus Pelagibacter sp.]MBA4283291.1 hypothetical protein [Candidatus Puniceispirillum sp.]
MNVNKSILLIFFLSITLANQSICAMNTKDEDYRPQESDLPRENMSQGIASGNLNPVDMSRKISLNANQCSLLSRGSVLRNAGRNLAMTDPIMKLNKLCKRYPYTIAVPTIEAFFAYCTKKNANGLVVGVVKSPACGELSYLGNSMMLYMYLKGSPEIFTPTGPTKNPKISPADKDFIGLWKHFNNVVNNKRKTKRGDEKLPFEKGESFERQLEAVMDRDPNSRGGYSTFKAQTRKRQKKHVAKMKTKAQLDKLAMEIRSLTPEQQDYVLRLVPVQ